MELMELENRIKIRILKKMIKKYVKLSKEIMEEYEKLSYNNNLFIITNEFKVIVEKLNKYNNVIEALQCEISKLSS